MNRRNFIECSAASALALPLAAQEPQLPRKAMPLDIILPDGTKLNTSRYLGKVCVVEFLFTTCSHCQEASRHLSALNREFGPRGLQPIGAAFNEGAMMLVPAFVKENNVNYPVGVVSRDKVLEYMSFSAMMRLTVPMVAFIDRRGNIRYQSNPVGQEALHSEPRMRQIIEELIKEPAGAASKGKKS
jgi:peroxiredoxin